MSLPMERIGVIFNQPHTSAQLYITLTLIFICLVYTAILGYDNTHKRLNVLLSYPSIAV